MARLIHQLRKTPLVVSGILIQILRFYLGENSVEFKPGDSFQTDDFTREDSLLVTTHDNFDLNVTQVRPALVIQRGDMKYDRLAMNDMLRTPYSDGSRTGFVMDVNGSYTILCLSKNSGVVERLAEEVSEVLIGFKEAIRNDFVFTRFDYRGTGAVGVLEEAQEIFMVPCSVLIAFTESWEVGKVAPVLSGGRIGIDISEVNDAFGHNIFPDDPVEVGCAAAKAVLDAKLNGITVDADDKFPRKSTATTPGICYRPDEPAISGSVSGATARVDDKDGYGEGFYNQGKYGQ